MRKRKEKGLCEVCEHPFNLCQNQGHMDSDCRIMILLRDIISNVVIKWIVTRVPADEFHNPHWEHTKFVKYQSSRR